MLFAANAALKIGAWQDHLFMLKKGSLCQQLAAEARRGTGGNWVGEMTHDVLYRSCEAVDLFQI